MEDSFTSPSGRQESLPGSSSACLCQASFKHCAGKSRGQIVSPLAPPNGPLFHANFQDGANVVMCSGKGRIPYVKGQHTQDLISSQPREIFLSTWWVEHLVILRLYVFLVIYSVYRRLSTSGSGSQDSCFRPPQTAVHAPKMRRCIRQGLPGCRAKLVWLLMNVLGWHGASADVRYTYTLELSIPVRIASTSLPRVPPFAAEYPTRAPPVLARAAVPVFVGKLHKAPALSSVQYG